MPTISPSLSRAPAKARWQRKYAGKTSPETAVDITSNVRRRSAISAARASSEASGHSGRLANDGNAATFWRAEATDTNAWLCIDLERIVTVSTVKLSFPFDGNWRYRVEISDDGNSGWKVVSDQTHNASSVKTQTLSGVNSARGRFLRVAFVGTRDAKLAALAEVAVLGNLSAQ